MTPAPAPGRPRDVPSLTTLRGVLAAWVVAYHFWNDVLKLFPSADVFSPVVRAGHMAVPAFFMLSGFVLAYNYADRFRTLGRAEVTRFWLLRLARVYPVHVVTLFVVLAMVAVSDRVGFKLAAGGYSTRDFVLNLFLAHTWVPHFTLNWNYPSWSISSEWFAYLLFPFGEYLGRGVWKSRGRSWMFSAVALAAGWAWLVVGKGWQTYETPLPFFEMLLVVPLFAAGGGLAGGVRGVATRAAWVRHTPTLCIFTAVAACYLPIGELAVGVMVFAFAGAVAALAAAGDSCGRAWRSRPAVFLGDVSYSLYMTHTLAQKVVYKLLPAGKFADGDVFTRTAVLAGYVILVAIACLISYFLVEKPFRKFLQSVLRRCS